MLLCIKNSVSQSITLFFILQSDPKSAIIKSNPIKGEMDMNTVKFCVFTDLHHFPGCYYTEAPKRLAEIQQHAQAEHCDFILQGGDFAHGPDRYPEFVAQYNDFSIPSYHCIGNNDSEHSTAEAVIKAYKMPNDFYAFDCKGFRIVVLNSCYYYKDGSYLPYQDNDYRPYGGSRGWIPPHELEWLKETLDASPYPCILIAHQSIERDTDAVFNAKEVLEVIDRANEKQHHKVLLVINGHRHRDYLRIRKNVAYLELNSASYDLMDVSHNLFPAELRAQYDDIRRTVIYNEPLHAIITVTDEGEIKIDGMEGSYFMGVDPTTIGNTLFDGASRASTPNISSHHFKLL